MTNEQKTLIMNMKSQGLGYKRIAAALQISENTVKTFLRRNRDIAPVTESETLKPDIPCCPKCGKELLQTPGRKHKRFCSTECRLGWWKSHPGLISRKAFYTCVCQRCGKSFESYGREKRTYCSRECYLEAVQRTVSR